MLPKFGPEKIEGEDCDCYSSAYSQV
ncbi:MAG: hypothetical protein ACJA16_003107, partial [Akkermansiaceae bacterium]